MAFLCFHLVWVNGGMSSAISVVEALLALLSLILLVLIDCGLDTIEAQVYAIEKYI